MGNRIVQNIFSNWTGLVVGVLLAFFVSPVVVNSLGNEAYGIWVLIVSITSYFTILDFGINTAVVKYVSEYLVKRNLEKLNEISSASFTFFFLMSLVAGIVCVVIAFNFETLFRKTSFSSEYILIVFLIVGLDLCINISFVVIQAILQGAQKFLGINIVNITVNIIKSILIVIFLLNGYSLIVLASIQLFASIIKYISLYYFLKHTHPDIRIRFTRLKKQTWKKIVNYSMYSFLIALAGKISFYSDSLIIGVYTQIEEITFFAIPSMITQYLLQFVWAIIAVFIPVISSKNALSGSSSISRYYASGSKNVLLIVSPIFVILLAIGEEFISIWMGSEYQYKSGSVLHILLLGYYFHLVQLVSQGLLKGLNQHKYIAYILILEAGLNLLLSIILVPHYGIIGVAWGTVIPMLLANVVLIPYFTCKTLKLPLFNYLYDSHFSPMLTTLGFFFVISLIPWRVDSFFDVFAFSGFWGTVYLCFCYLFLLDQNHKGLVNAYARKFYGH